MIRAFTTPVAVRLRQRLCKGVEPLGLEPACCRRFASKDAPKSHAFPFGLTQRYRRALPPAVVAHLGSVPVMQGLLNRPTWQRNEAARLNRAWADLREGGRDGLALATVLKAFAEEGGDAAELDAEGGPDCGGIPLARLDLSDSSNAAAAARRFDQLRVFLRGAADVFEGVFGAGGEGLVHAVAASKAAAGAASEGKVHDNAKGWSPPDREALEALLHAQILRRAEAVASASASSSGDAAAAASPPARRIQRVLAARLVNADFVWDGTVRPADTASAAEDLELDAESVEVDERGHSLALVSAKPGGPIAYFASSLGHFQGFRPPRQVVAQLTVAFVCEETDASGAPVGVRTQWPPQSPWELAQGGKPSPAVVAAAAAVPAHELDPCRPTPLRTCLVEEPAGGAAESKDDSTDDSKGDDDTGDVSVSYAVQHGPQRLLGSSGSSAPAGAVAGAATTSALLAALMTPSASSTLPASLLDQVGLPSAAAGDPTHRRDEALAAAKAHLAAAASAAAVAAGSAPESRRVTVHTLTFEGSVAAEAPGKGFLSRLLQSLRFFHQPTLRVASQWRVTDVDGHFSEAGSGRLLEHSHGSSSSSGSGSGDSDGDGDAVGLSGSGVLTDSPLLLAAKKAAVAAASLHREAAEEDYEGFTTAVFPRLPPHVRALAPLAASMGGLLASMTAHAPAAVAALRREDWRDEAVVISALAAEALVPRGQGQGTAAVLAAQLRSGRAGSRSSKSGDGDAGDGSAKDTGSKDRDSRADAGAWMLNLGGGGGGGFGASDGRTRLERLAATRPLSLTEVADALAYASSCASGMLEGSATAQPWQRMLAAEDAIEAAAEAAEAQARERTQADGKSSGGTGSASASASTSARVSLPPISHAGVPWWQELGAETLPEHVTAMETGSGGSSSSFSSWRLSGGGALVAQRLGGAGLPHAPTQLVNGSSCGSGDAQSQSLTAADLMSSPRWGSLGAPALRRPLPPGSALVCGSVALSPFEDRTTLVRLLSRMHEAAVRPALALDPGLRLERDFQLQRLMLVADSLSSFGVPAAAEALLRLRRALRAHVRAKIEAGHREAREAADAAAAAPGDAALAAKAAEAAKQAEAAEAAAVRALAPLMRAGGSSASSSDTDSGAAATATAAAAAEGEWSLTRRDADPDERFELAAIMAATDPTGLLIRVAGSNRRDRKASDKGKSNGKGKGSRSVQKAEAEGTEEAAAAAASADGGKSGSSDAVHSAAGREGSSSTPKPLPQALLDDSDDDHGEELDSDSDSESDSESESKDSKSSGRSNDDDDNDDDDADNGDDGDAKLAAARAAYFGRIESCARLTASSLAGLAGAGLLEGFGAAALARGDMDFCGAVGSGRRMRSRPTAASAADVDGDEAEGKPEADADSEKAASTKSRKARRSGSSGGAMRRSGNRMVGKPGQRR